MDTAPTHVEVQRFRQPWLLAIVLGIAGLMWWGFVTQIVLGRPWGTKPAPDAAVWALTVVFGILLPAWFLVGAMHTVVDDDGIRIRFFGVHRRTIGIDRIAAAEAVTYHPLLDYGGWGIRLGLQGWCYNVSGNRGVRLRLVDGRTVMIGSGRADELAEAIRRRLGRAA